MVRWLEAVTTGAVVATVAVVAILVQAQGANGQAIRRICGDVDPSAVQYSNTNLYSSCIKEDRREGFCLHDYQCYENETIACGGDLPDSDLRTSPLQESECGGLLWCCVFEQTIPSTPTLTPTAIPTSTSTATPTPTATPMATRSSTPMPKSTVEPEIRMDGCMREYESGTCTSCVSLYRPFGDVAAGQRSESGLYCGGALVAPRVVLTAATCVVTVANEQVWLRVPAAEDPAYHYNVVRKIKHPKYKSASHANDFALLVLHEDVKGFTDFACMGLQTPLTDDCAAAGFNDTEHVLTTVMSVRQGECRPRRKPRMSDVACGTSAEGSCHAKLGAPVLCPVTSDGQGGLVVAGVVRQPCVGHAVMLGSLQPHAAWLQQELSLLGLQPAQYT